jgi:hypothetical protein
MTAHQVCSQRRIALEVAVGEAIFDRDVAAFNTGRDRLSKKQLLGMTDATAGVHCGARRCGMVACAGSIPLDVGPSDHLGLPFGFSRYLRKLRHLQCFQMNKAIPSTPSPSSASKGPRTTMSAVAPRTTIFLVPISFGSPRIDNSRDVVVTPVVLIANRHRKNGQDGKSDQQSPHHDGPSKVLQRVARHLPGGP